MTVFTVSARTTTSNTTVSNTTVLGFGFIQIYYPIHDALSAMSRFAASLVRCRAPMEIMAVWLMEAYRQIPRKAAKVGDVAMVRPAIRPARDRAVHHGEHLLNFHRC